MRYLSSVQARDDGATLNAKIVDLRKKWSDICLGKHRRRRMVASDAPWLGSEFPGMMGLQYKAESGDQAKENCDGLQTKIT